jgi:hypothetical protein
MRTPIEIRNDAYECLRMAEQASTARHKAVLLLIAQGWASLAEQLELMQTPSDDKPSESAAV